MKILNKELEFNFNDADDAERFEKTMKETGEKLQNINEKDKTRSQLIREVCNYIFECFDKIFGKGTHEKIFENKCNLDKCIEAYENLMEELVKQEQASIDKVTNFAQKYSPNRTRRTKK